MTVGDRRSLHRARSPSSRLLERTSLVKRRAPGTERQEQLIAANIDTAFIATSCNQDFNVARLERYIALACDARIAPVVVVAKTDLVTDPQSYIDAARAVSETVDVVARDARGREPRTELAAWCKLGKSVAFLGSSSVGKSTLTNALLDSKCIEIQAIREDAAKEPHTTTWRELHAMPNGCLTLGCAEKSLPRPLLSRPEETFSDAAANHPLLQRGKFPEKQRPAAMKATDRGSGGCHRAQCVIGLRRLCATSPAL